jgi:hypothetical protein
MRNHTNPGSKSAEEVQREVRASRAEVEDTLEAIQERLSPGQIFDQAVAYLRSSGGNEFMRNFGATVRDNPVPVALLGTGLAWLMLASPRAERGFDEDQDLLGGYPEDDYSGDYAAGYDPVAAYTPGYHARDYEEAVFAGGPLDADTMPPAGTATDAPGIAQRTQESAQGARRKAHELAESASEWGAEALDTAQEWSAEAGAAARSAQRGARRLAAGARDRLNVTGRQLRHGAHRAGARAGYYGRRAQRGFLDTLHEQPLILGAVGLALGAAIGAALPATETEDEWLGDTRDRLKEQVTEAGREQLAKAGAAAGAAYDAAREEADRQGLTPEKGVAATESMVRKFERVAEAATDAAKTEAERQGLGQTDGKPV